MGWMVGNIWVEDMDLLIRCIAHSSAVCGSTVISGNERNLTMRCSCGDFGEGGMGFLVWLVS